MERGVLVIDATRRRRLRAIVDYVRGIHHHIDPDRFSIEESRLEAYHATLDTGDDHDSLRIGVTYDDILFLQTLIDAAATFSGRSDFPEVDGVDDGDFDELEEWLGRQSDALFRAPPTIH